jgi:uncharacterized membrane protein YdbT with pleckstrin-like domain
MSVPSWVTLGEGEEIVWSGRPSMLLVAGSLLIGFLVVAAGSALYGVFIPADSGLQWVGLLVVVAGIAYMAYTGFRHQSTRYVITSNEVYRKEGMFSRQVTSLRLDRIQNTTFEQSLVERLFAFGDVHVDTAGTGGTEITFEAVSRPQEVSGLLTKQLDRVAHRSTPR